MYAMKSGFGVLSLVAACVGALLHQPALADSSPHPAAAMGLFNDGFVVVAQAGTELVAPTPVCPLGKRWLKQACIEHSHFGFAKEGSAVPPVTAQEALDIQFGKGTLEAVGLSPYDAQHIVIFYRIVKPQSSPAANERLP